MAEDISPPQMPAEPEFRYELRIPKDRIAVLIGKNGEVKDRLESATNSKIEIDSNDGDVTVSGHDVIQLYQLRDIVKAIGRGFNPEVANLLLRSDYSFELIQLVDYSPHQNHQQRMKGRVIGSGGKTRNLIKAIEETIPSSKSSKDENNMMVIARSFDINKPGSSPKKMLGGILGGAVKSGIFENGDDIEICPGRVYEEKNQLAFTPYMTKIVGLMSGGTKVDNIHKGGSVAIMTSLDPSVVKSDQLLD